MDFSENTAEQTIEKTADEIKKGSEKVIMGLSGTLEELWRTKKDIIIIGGIVVAVYFISTKK